MRLYFDLALGRLVRKKGFAEALTALSFKRGDAALLEVSFCRDGVAAALAVSGDPVQPVEMVFAVKASVAAGSETLLLADTWTFVEASAVWRASLNADTEALAELMGSAASINLLGEFTFTDDNGGPTTSQTLTVTVHNDVWKGTEGTPLSLPSPETWLAEKIAPLALVAPPVSGTGAVLGMTVSFDPVLELYRFGLDANDRETFSTDGLNMIPTTGTYHICYVNETTGLWSIDLYHDNVLLGTYEAASGIPEYPWDADWTVEGLEVAAVLDVGTVGVLGQFAAVNGVVTHQCVDVDPMTWKEIEAPAVLFTEQTLTSSQKRQARTNIGARQLPPQDFGIIYNLAIFGDSIPGATSGLVTYGSGYLANGFGAHLRYAMQGMIELTFNPIDGTNDFALGSRTTSSFMPGGPDRATFDAMLASAADTVLYALGNNDVTSIAIATTKANMLSQWDEIEASGKKLAIMSLFPGGINRPTDYIQGVLQLNHWMEYQAAIRGALYIDITQVCDDNRDGVSDSAWMQDHIHPNNGGACRVGYYTADRLMPYADPTKRLVIPAYGGAAWKTPNSHATLGTLGSNQLATNWTASAVGAGTVLQNNILTRTDGRAGRWQQFVVSGATEAGTFLVNPTHYIQAYVTSAAPFAVSVGDRFQLICETYFPTESTFYGIRAFMHDTTDGYTQRHDLNHEGAYAAMKSGKFAPYRHGILRSNELVITTAGTRQLRAWFYAYGNGTVNIGPFGIIKL